MDTKQFRQYIVRPTLKHLGLWSKIAEDLVMGTIAQESHFKYLDQLTPGPGPAYGVVQMEAATHRSHWAWLRRHPDLKAKVEALLAPQPSKLEQLRSNLAYSVAMCRIHYYRRPQALPKDLDGIATYYKKYYNTYKGKATVAQFKRNFKKYVK